MKAAWVAFGVVVATIFLATIWSIGNGLTAGSRFQEAARQAADEALPQLLGSWDARKLEELAAPELKESVSFDQMAKMMADLKSKLGKLEKLQPAKVGNFETPGVDKSGGPFIVAPCVAKAKFEKGDATIEIKMVRVEGKWRVGNFFVRR